MHFKVKLVHQQACSKSYVITSCLVDQRNNVQRAYFLIAEVKQRRAVRVAGVWMFAIQAELVYEYHAEGNIVDCMWKIYPLLTVCTQ